MMKLKLSQRELRIIYLVIGAVLLGLIIWLVGRSSGRRKGFAYQDLPDEGLGIPPGWSPGPDVLKLYDAMDSGASPWDWGTDEDAIFSVVEGKSDDQLVAIYNEFNVQHFQEDNCDVLCWFEAELSDDDLTRALAPFYSVMGQLQRPQGQESPDDGWETWLPWNWF